MSKRIYQYPEVTELQEGDVMLIDKEGNETAKSILASKVAPALMSKTITERGTYKASDDGVRGYNEVDVDIPYTDVHVASGPIATFEGEDLPLKSLTASIVPVQAGSGDPSPTNVRPISGWSGVTVNVTANLFDKAKSREVLLPFMQGQTIYVMQDSANTFNLYVGYTDGTSDSFIMEPNTKHQFTFAKDSYGVGITESALNVLIAQNKNMMVSLNDFTGIVPFGTTTTIPFTDGQGQSVEVFGGSVDVVNGGEQPSRWGKIDLSTCEFAQGTSGDYTFFWANVNPIKANNFNFLCSQYKNLGHIRTQLSDLEIGVYNSNTEANIQRIVIRDDRYSEYTPEQFTQAMSGVQLAYELLDPTTFYTQPTSIKSLDGVNNVFASTGDVDVEYQTVWVRPTE